MLSRRRRGNDFGCQNISTVLLHRRSLHLCRLSQCASFIFSLFPVFVATKGGSENWRRDNLLFAKRIALPSSPPFPQRPHAAKGQFFLRADAVCGRKNKRKTNSLPPSPAWMDAEKMSMAIPPSPSISRAEGGREGGSRCFDNACFACCSLGGGASVILPTDCCCCWG